MSRGKEKKNKEKNQKGQGNKPDKNKPYYNKPESSGGGKRTTPPAPEGADRDSNVPERNDWSFYALNEQIAKDLGSIPYSYLPGLGAPLNVASMGSNGAQYSSTQKYFESCVCVLNYSNTPGVGSSATSAINMAALQLYTYVRHVNSGATNYEAADLMMYILAMADIYAAYFECKRLIGIAQLFSPENRNIPIAFANALGVNMSDLQSNLSNYRGELNILASKINSFAVPKYFKAFLRHAYVASLIFSDSTSIRGQFYIFKRTGYYTWSPTTDEAGTSLVYNDYVGGLSPMSTYINTLKVMVDAVYLDQDAGTISGDILKTFKEDELYRLETTDEKYVVEPVIDEDILSQIENSYAALSGTGQLPTNSSTGTALTEIYTSGTLDVKQENQLIVFEPTIEVSGRATTLLSRLFNSHKDYPDYKDNLEWSRLIAITTPFSVTSGVKMEVVGCGLELVHYYSMYHFNGSSYDVTYFTNLITSNQVSPSTEYLGRVEQFDWHPILYWMTNTSTTAPPTLWSVFADLKKSTVIQNATLASIHDAANAASYYGFNLPDYTIKAYK